MKLSRVSIAVSLSMALIACGGGGGDDAPIANPDRSDIDSVFRLGVLATDLSASYEQAKVPFFAGFLVGVSNATGGSTSPTIIGCSAGGTVTASINRTGVYVGFNANDSASLSFNNCQFTGVATIYNGSAFLVSTNGAIGLDNTGVTVNNLQFRLVSTNLSLTRNGLRVVHNGGMNVTYNANSTSLSIDETVSTSHSWATFNPATAAASALTTTAATGARLVASNTASNAFTLAYTGRMTATTTDGAVNLEITTPTTISGTRNATSGALMPTSGIMNVNETSVPIATRGTFAPSSLTISGDTDRNGTLDLTFSTIY